MPSKKVEKPLKNGFNQSAVASFLSCRKKHDFAFVQNLTPRVDKPALSLGTLVHAGMEAAALEYVESSKRAEVSGGYIVWSHESIEEGVNAKYEQYVKEHALFDEEIALLQEQVILAQQLAIRAFDHFIREFEPYVTADGQPIVEYKVRVPIKRNKLFDHFHGTIDIVAVERATGAVWLVDWKVRGTLQPIEDEELNIQAAAYQRAALKGLGIKTVGSIIFQIFNELPKKPEQNKDGSMSKKDIKSDWPTYKAALLEAGLNPDDYLEMATKLNGKEFFRLSYAYRSEKELGAIWKEVILSTASEMAKKNVRRVRNLSAWNCKGCQFRHLCLEELRGGDTAYIRDTDFMQSTRNEDSYESEE